MRKLQDRCKPILLTALAFGCSFLFIEHTYAQLDPTFGELTVVGGTQVGAHIHLNSQFHESLGYEFVDGQDFRIHAIDSNRSPLVIRPKAQRNSIVVTETGIGIGTRFPEAGVHVYTTDGFQGKFDEARVRINFDRAINGMRTMFEIINNGPARFDFENTNLDSTWTFQTNASDNFMINRLGSGGNEFSIRKNGMVTMGPGGQKNFVLHPNGNLDISGTLNQLSDRNAKAAVQLADVEEVLEKVAELPIFTWNYKDDKPAVIHLGPMAQDFRAAFGLGENETSIATIDASGVAMAAIQALDQQSQSSREKVDELLARVSQINAILESRD